MKSGQANRAGIVFSVALTALVALLGVALHSPDWRPGEQFLHASYDSLHAFSGIRENALADSSVVIVYLDLPSFLRAKQDPAQPWPRGLHAQLLRHLKSAGARAVVFDIVFSHAGVNAAGDDEFAAAIREHGRVVLAAEYNNKSMVATDGAHDRARVGMIEPIHEPFARAAAGVGIASLGIDRDRGVRRFVAGFTDEPQPALAWAAATALQSPATQPADAMRAANQRWVRYYGPPLSIPHVSYSLALEPGGVRADFFRDKIVFVGSRPLVGMFNAQQDEFGNPFDFWRNKELFMPGVEVHATELLNLLRGDWLRRLPQTGEVLLLLLAAIFGGALAWLRPIPAAITALTGAGLALGLSFAGFAKGVWFPWLIVSGAQIPAALGGSVLFYSLEWYRTRLRYEARIREQAALIDKAHDAIFVQGLDGRILYANPSAERLYGWTIDELQRGSATEEMYSSDAAATQAARAAAVNSGEWNGELRQQTKSGQVVTVASRWTLIRDEAGRPKALLLMNSDITEKKSLEQQFLRTQRMNTIGSLAGGMAHDLNNALAPILMGTQLLRRKTADAESRGLLDMMETSTQRGADMVRQVLLFARGRAGDLERLELTPVIKELEKMVRETFPKSIAVESFSPRDLWAVRGNLTQVHQVLLNLCVNARDAMPNGGKLSFVADNVEISAVEAAAIPEGQPGKFVSVLVSDTGTGMPPEVLAKIFEPFFTTKGEGKGTGIGLATVMRIVKSHGGFLRVESELGRGTAVEVFLPCASEIAPVAAPITAAGQPRGNGELILLADDEQAIRDLVSAELTAFGYRVLAATNGAEAVTHFKQQAGEVRLFITDSAMPVMEGRHAVAELRKLKPSLPVILTTGESGAERDEIAGAVVLNKPFALEELLAAVRASLR